MNHLTKDWEAKMKNCFLSVSVSVFFWAILFGGILPAAVPGDYLGYKECIFCHDENGNAWQKTQHARAFEGLKKMPQERLSGCLTCHVTGYGKPGGFVSFESTPELINVQCEECHGTGKSHAANPGEKGSITAKPEETKCLGCHTPRQDPKFDYATKSKLVHPKQVSKP